MFNFPVSKSQQLQMGDLCLYVNKRTGEMKKVIIMFSYKQKYGGSSPNQYSVIDSTCLDSKKAVNSLSWVTPRDLTFLRKLTNVEKQKYASYVFSHLSQF